MKSSFVVALGSALLAAGCAPAVQVTPQGGPYPPRREVEALLVFSTQTPTCPYQELAILTAYQGHFGESLPMENVLLAVKKQARSLGADAIVALRQVNGGGDVPRDGYSGTAIRFSDEACAR